ncbi:response regulator [Paramagnetospirillum magneticum]|uniref:Response regulator containing a CheY-like receiver domain and an HD-GYP domain n=1 Tax=Paramagnetospirillum magneticum (strain ATCC 700264 / AMB-1) TaxID=342108 RepID=Q2W682_PARM1|nr:two-component system response regulator [Paramagnetospirillum magneticum]BAE50643.1 Response regulator containing a CheY-like receiver domain and an HD-GYP domain [Paramagnetospirillum magneticum AMB-1]
MLPADFMDRATILVVDDSPDDVWLMSELLKADYRVKVANSGERGLKIAMGNERPDLVLLDVMMPDIDGYEVCRQLKTDSRTHDIPVIFLTSKTRMAEEKRGLDMGAVDYITKPFSPSIVLARVKAHLRLKSSADFLRDQNRFLEREVAKRTKDVTAVKDVTILAMASLAETRDLMTGNHIRRTQYYMSALATALQDHPRFAPLLDEAAITMLFKSAPLHDIGKIGIPDCILLKPGRLTPEEFEVMKTHAALGRNAIESAERWLGTRLEFLTMAKEITHYHHERWDGDGYPEGLSGDDIPVSARLMAVADVYDALISRRVYKEPIPHAEAVDIIIRDKGGRFDPDVVDAFVGIQDEFRAIARQYADRPTP